MRGMYRSQVQIPSPRPLTPSSCLRAECITGRKGKPHGQIHSQLMSPRGMHRRSKLMCLNTSSSQLTSPRGMHLERQHHGQLQALLPTHVFARNASGRAGTVRMVRMLPTHVSARNASGLCRRAALRSQLPTHVSARNASCDRLRKECMRCLPTHVSARNASTRALINANTMQLPTHVSARNASAKHSKK